MRKHVFYAHNTMMEILVEKTRNKNMYLKIVDNQIVALVPPYVSDAMLEAFVASHYDKFVKYISKAKDKVYISYAENYFFLFGKKIPYETLKGFSNAKVVKKGSKYYLQASEASQAEVEKAINDFCKAQLETYIARRVPELEAVMGLKSHAFKVGNKLSAWGTNYLVKNLITFSSTLAHYPKDVIDYVIFHELAHSFFHDHSDNFWAVVARYCPDYKNLKLQLRRDRQIEEE